jgi:hypothetical protein
MTNLILRTYQRDVLTFIAINIILGWVTLKVFVLDFAPVHDYAADFLLANVIRDEGILLTGHYSRFGFHHPGPFWFYLNYLFEFCLSWFPLTRFQIWTIGSVVINSSLLFFAGRGLSMFLFDKIKYEIVFILIALLLLLAGGDFLATWMPNRLITLYIAFFVCLLNICRYNLSYLPWATLFCAMLVHGYITMPILTLPFLLLSLIVGLILNKNQYKRSKGDLYKNLLQSGLIATIFLIPLIADILFLSDSNLSKILATYNGLLNSPKPTWGDVKVFYWQLVFDQPYSKQVYWASFLAILPLLFFRQRVGLLRLVGIFSFFLFITGIVLMYYKTTPAPLYPFIAKFYIGFPSVMIAAIWCLLIARVKPLLNDTNYLTKLTVIIAVVLSIHFSKKHESPIWADPEDARPIRLFSDQIQSDQKGRTVVLNHSQHDLWGIIAGIMVELDRRHIRSCSTWAQMAFLFTPQMICGTNSKPDYLIVKYSECKDQCIVESKGFGLKSLK